VVNVIVGLNRMKSEQVGFGIIEKYKIMTEVIKKYRSIPVKMSYTTIGDIVKWDVLSIGIETEMVLTPDNVRGIIDKFSSSFSFILCKNLSLNSFSFAKSPSKSFNTT
jgi:hypothetical protein